MVPLGSLLAGLLAHFMGAPQVVILSGICCIAGAAGFFRRLPALSGLIRPIYVRKGIILEPADSLHPASHLHP
jgi:hypothetical protein